MELEDLIPFGSYRGNYQVDPDFLVEIQAETDLFLCDIEYVLLRLKEIYEEEKDDNTK